MTHQQKSAPKNAYTVENSEHPFTIGEMDWAVYQTQRPTYPLSMWDTWIKYHKAHAGLLNAAHDIGAGPGIVSMELSQLFSHVYVSDPGESNIATARRLLQPATKFTFCQQAAEIPWLEKSSIDFSCICMALHWMDSETVLRNVASSLRPGGTLAICAYSFMIKFPDYQRLEHLWSETWKTAVGSFLKNGDISPAMLKGMRNFMVGLDGTAIPGDSFEDVHRIQLNIKENDNKPFCFVPDGTFDLPPCQIEVNEVVQHAHDSSWRREVDLAWLKGYLASSNMPFGELIPNLSTWREFENIVSEFGNRILVEWPVSIILASRRSDHPLLL